MLWLFQIPQRYRFSSKSQLYSVVLTLHSGCFRYHKGTDFQANHNYLTSALPKSLVVLDTTKVQIFKQITTSSCIQIRSNCCFRYHKGTDFQANHNSLIVKNAIVIVVLDTTKVQIFKQITTTTSEPYTQRPLFQIPQRYRFSSKSQLTARR